MKRFIIFISLAVSGCSFLESQQESLIAQRRVPLHRQIQSLDKSKKNLCTITINSDNETKLFKQYLPTFNHIELTPEDPNTEDNNWFQKACNSGLQCDVLMISGHFGGTFFSETSKVRLAATDLEQLACSNTCPGILQNPKEVYLFGCNTLAGKSKDRRTPAEYAQVLVRDGFSHSEAQVLAAIRYSPLGNSFRDKMTRIFADVPHIYGFDSVGPSGRNVHASLDKYLKGLSPYEQYFETAGTAENNPHWSTSMKAYAQTQARGVTKQASLNSFACKLTDTQTPNHVKLLSIQKLFQDEKELLSNIEYLDHYMDRSDSYYDWRPKSKAISELESMIRYDLMVNKKAKSMVQKYLQRELPGMLSFQIALLNVGKSVGWWTGDVYGQYVRSLFGDFTQGIKMEQSDVICSRSVKIPGLTIANFKKGKWELGDLLAITCLAPADSKISDKIVSQNLKTSKYTPETDIAIYAISQVGLLSDSSKKGFAKFWSHLPQPNEEQMNAAEMGLEIILKYNLTVEKAGEALMQYFANKEMSSNEYYRNEGVAMALVYQMRNGQLSTANMEKAIREIMAGESYSSALLRKNFSTQKSLCPHLKKIKELEEQLLPSEQQSWKYLLLKDGRSTEGFSGYTVTKEKMLVFDDLEKVCLAQ